MDDKKVAYYLDLTNGGELDAIRHFFIPVQYMEILIALQKKGKIKEKKAEEVMRKILKGDLSNVPGGAS